MILDNTNIKTIHMIGIDGISMSGLAEILISLGYKITGSDLNYSKRLASLSEKGAVIFKGHDAGNITDQDIVIHTTAVHGNNPEIIAAKKLGIKTIDRSVLLGEIMNKYNEKIAVSGTHGKSTTTAMTSFILLKAALDPTIHIGAEFAPINGTTHLGSNKYFITEACEYTESYLRLQPTLSIITNIEFDHGDYFTDIEHVKRSFTNFLNLLPQNGACVLNIDDKCTLEIIDLLKNKNIYTFSTKNKSAFLFADKLSKDSLGYYTFDLYKNNIFECSITLKVPGIYNLYNALAAATAAYYLHVPSEIIKEALEKFQGTVRRFELKGIVNNIKVIDDYAHHPSEIQSTLTVFDKNRENTIWCVFQPHTYTRTKLLLEKFAVSFENADRIIVADIYAAREIDTGEVSSKILADKIRKAGKDASYISGFENITKYLLDNVKIGDVLVTMGAGDIYKVGEMFISADRP